MSSDVPWLSAREERLWRGWLRMNAQLLAQMQRELQEDSGLSLSDFDVLVHLTDDPQGRVRVSDLAEQLTWERSRVSHHVTRMQRRGLVAREECPDDGRGAFVAVTAAGREAIEQAAPHHVRTVRRLVFDVLGESELAGMEAALAAMRERLG